MGVPITTSELLTAILNALGGNTAPPPDPGPDPTTSPTGMSTIENWRARTASPNVDGATGRRIWLVPTGREWQLMGISATLASGVTAGSRQVEIYFNPGVNNVTVFHHRFPAGTGQAASLTYTYNFAMGQPLFTAPVSNFLSAPLPPSVLPPASVVVLWDRAQIAPAVDVWSNVNLLVLERVIS